MKVVSNSSPLCYLRLIDQVHLLPQMFGEILIPEAVARELGHEGAPGVVREWISKPPNWLIVQKVPARLDPRLERLHAGEREAILFARQVKADLLLLDERAARHIAREQGLNVTGLIGILDEATTLGLVDLLAAVDRLRRTSFRASPQLLKTLLERHY